MIEWSCCLLRRMSLLVALTDIVCLANVRFAPEADIHSRSAFDSKRTSVGRLLPRALTKRLYSVMLLTQFLS
jgi:hypothetical protein